MTSAEFKKYKKFLAEKRVKSRYGLLRTVTGSTRYRILMLLLVSPRGLTVSDIGKILGASLSRVSHQMRILRSKSVVSSERNSRMVTYAIADRSVRKYLLA